MNTNFLLDSLASALFNDGDYSGLPTKLFIGLSTTAPTVDGTGVSEPPAGSGYHRVELTSLTNPFNGMVTNEQTIAFGESTTSWGTITHFVIYGTNDNFTGPLLMYGELSAPRDVGEGTIVAIKAGGLKLYVQNPS